MSEPGVYATGNLVWWHAGGWWGQVPAEVLCLSASGKRVRIKAVVPRWSHDKGVTENHWAYVKPTSLSHRATSTSGTEQ